MNEIGGRTVRSQLCKNNFSKENCGRNLCGLCSSEVGGSRGRCWTQNIGYSYICRRCDESDVYMYVGESSRSCYTRHQQHLQKYSLKARGKGKADNEEGATFMWNHTKEVHGGVTGPNNGADDYEMYLDGAFRDAFTRQLEEDVRMRVGVDEMARKRCKDRNCELNVQLMNGKGEYYKPKSVITTFSQW